MGNALRNSVSLIIEALQGRKHEGRKRVIPTEAHDSVRSGGICEMMNDELWVVDEVVEVVVSVILR